MTRLVDQVAVPAVEIDAEGRVSSTNRAWDELVPREVVGRAHTGVGADYLAVVRAAADAGDPDAARVRDLLEDLLAGRADTGVVEYPCPTPVDHRWFRLTAHRLVDGGGAVLLHAPWHAPSPSMGSDVASDGLVHDLANRLHVASGMLGLLEGRGEQATAEQRATWAAKAEDNLERAMGLLEALRDHRGPAPPGPRPVPLAEAVEEVVGRVGVEAVVDVPAGLPVTCDPDHLDRILTNLLENARIHGAPPVVVAARQVGERVEVRVTDAGPGIPPELHDRLFRPGTRGERVDGGVGSGLGLAIVRELLRVNAGTIRHVADDPGTTWLVSLSS